MTDEHRLFTLIQKANEEQTDRLAKVAEAHTKLLRDEIRTNVKEVEVRLEKALKKIEDLKKKHIETERRLRRNNIVIFGLQPTRDLLNNTLTKLNEILHLGLQESDVNNIYRTGKEKSVIIIELLSFLKKKQIFSKVKELKGSGIAITNDLCYEDREDRKVLRFHQQKALAQKLEAKIKGNTLIVENKVFTLEDLLNLEANLQSEEESDNEETTLLQQLPERNSTDIVGDNSKKHKQNKIVFRPNSQADGGNVLRTRSQRKQVDKN